jgi:uncharacterized protein
MVDVRDEVKDRRRASIDSVAVLAAVLLLLALSGRTISGLIGTDRMRTWTTVFVSVLIQAVPFLVLGVALSAAIAVFVPRSFWVRALPSHPALAVPVASVAGVVLPGCECGSVPVAASLIRRGVSPAAALAFLLAAPAINPIVLTSTAIAFPNHPEMVLARAVASFVIALVMGWLWLRFGRSAWLRLPHRPELDARSRGRAFWTAFQHDVMHAGGFLVIGAAAAASINVLVPERWLQDVAAVPGVCRCWRSRSSRCCCPSAAKRTRSSRHRCCSSPLPRGWFSSRLDQPLI